MAFDSKCYDFADRFLHGENEFATAMETALLAQVIQDAAEDWIAGWRADRAWRVDRATPEGSRHDRT
jgi:hypothetical protein